MRHIFTFLISLLFTSTITANDSGQLFIIGLNKYPVPQETLSLIRDYNISGVMFYGSVYDNIPNIQKAINDIQSQVTVSSPLLFAIDQEGGPVQRIKKNVPAYPSAKEIGEKQSEPYSRHIASSIAKDLKEAGIHMNFAPVLDVHQNDNNSVIADRSFGSTAEVVTNEGRYVIEAHQKIGIIPVLKHFPGHGQPTKDSHHLLPTHSSPKTFESIDLAPFKTLISEGKASAIMVSHVLYPHIDPKYPASLSKKIITDLLGDDLKFEGLIISDDLSMGAIRKHCSLEEASQKAIEAGIHQQILIEDEAIIRTLLEHITLNRLFNKRFNKQIKKHTIKVKQYKSQHISNL